MKVFIFLIWLLFSCKRARVRNGTSRKFCCATFKKSCVYFLERNWQLVLQFIIATWMMLSYRQSWNGFLTADKKIEYTFVTVASCWSAFIDCLYLLQNDNNNLYRLHMFGAQEDSWLNLLLFVHGREPVFNLHWEQIYCKKLRVYKKSKP